MHGNGDLGQNKITHTHSVKTSCSKSGTKHAIPSLPPPIPPTWEAGSQTRATQSLDPGRLSATKTHGFPRGCHRGQILEQSRQSQSAATHSLLLVDSCPFVLNRSCNPSHSPHAVQTTVSLSLLRPLAGQSCISRSNLAAEFLQQMPNSRWMYLCIYDLLATVSICLMNCLSPSIAAHGQLALCAKHSGSKVPAPFIDNRFSHC